MILFIRLNNIQNEIIRLTKEFLYKSYAMLNSKDKI